MITHPRVSWLIPVKNGMPYLTQTLASIEAQTFKDFEILVWDNGSTDGTVEELGRWIPHRLRGKIITGQPRGVGGALAGLVELAESTYCARIDADDCATPDRLAIQVDFLDKNPEIALVGGQLQMMDSAGRDLGRATDYPLNHEDIVYRLIHENAIGHPSVLFRKDKILAVGNYKDDNKFEDYELWLRLAAEYRMANLPGVALHYRLHEKSVTRTAIVNNQLESWTDKAFIQNAFNLTGWDEGTAKKFRARKLKFMLPAAMRLTRHFSQKGGLSSSKQLRSPELIRSLQDRLNSRDVVSTVILGLLTPRRGDYWREIGIRMARWSLKIPVLNPLIQYLLRKMKKQKFSRWREEQIRKGSEISDDLFFKGKSAPYPWLTTGEKIVIERGVTIWIASDELANPKLKIGNETFIGFQTFLGAYQPLHIGDRVLIGAFCYIITANHRFDRRDVAIKDQGFSATPIQIEDDVWLGTHVVVLPGVTIGRGAIVGAGSVVNRDIPPWEIWGGVPARFLKNRGNEAALP